MKLVTTVSLAALALSLTGCVVAPVAPAYGYGAPPGVAYVAPLYPMPAPGYVWAYRARFGWGWYHPHYGWR